MLGARAVMPGYTTDVNAADEELRAYYSTFFILWQMELICLRKS